MPRAASALVLATLVVAACGSGDQTTAGAAGGKGKTGLKLVKVGTFDAPVYLTAPDSDRSRQYVVEQGGTIRVIRSGDVQDEPFLDIRKLVTSGGEQGLLSVAFAPDFATSRRFYVYYTDKGAQQRVVQYTAASADRADPGSAKLVLRMADPEPNHNGGLLKFGPGGHLFIGTGDGGGAGDQHGARGNAQDTTSLLGKLLRIDPKPDGGYTTPKGNPFRGKPGRDEVYAYGLRNPWRFAFDRKTDDLTIGDVGQDAVEEIDAVRSGRGRNFGWRVFEGNRRYRRGESAPRSTRPVLTFTHDAGWCSITGGVVVRDKRVPGAYGKYLFGDFCKGDVMATRLARPRKTLRKTGLRVDALASFGEDARGRVYLISTGGPVYRLAAR